ncbi:MAG: Lpg1974 family pore-forming outer membrane protein [Gemmataceae bacterium]
MKRLSLLAMIMVACMTQAADAQYYNPYNYYAAARYYNGHYRPQYPNPYYRMPAAAYPAPRPYPYAYPQPYGGYPNQAPVRYLPKRTAVSQENPYYRTNRQTESNDRTPGPTKGRVINRLVRRTKEDSKTRQVSNSVPPPGQVIGEPTPVPSQPIQDVIVEEPRIPATAAPTGHHVARHHPHPQAGLEVMQEIAPTLPTMACPDGGCEEACAPDCEPCRYPRKCRKKLWRKFSLHGSFLYLTARDADIPLGQPYNGNTPAATGVGTVAVADPDYSPAFRAGGAYHINECASIEGTFWWYQSNTSGSFEAPGGTSFRNFLVLPQIPLIGTDALNITSRYDIDFLMADAHFRGSLYKGCRGYLDYLVGGRYAHLDQDLEVVYSNLGTRTIRSEINFDGGGPRVGIDGGYHTKCGIFAYGRGMFSLLGGHFGAKWEQRDVNAGLEGLTEIGDDRIVPITELEVGVGWVSPKGRIRVSGGYYIAAWFNTMTQSTLANSIQGNGQNPNFTHNGDNFSDTLVFDGVVGNIEIRY